MKRIKNESLIRDKADLLIDVDVKNKKIIKKINYRYRWLAYYFKELLPAKFKVYKTKKGYHFYIYLLNKNQNYKNYELVLFQSLLMSDWLRECRNYYRIKQNFIDWNIMFSVKRNEVNEKFFRCYIIKRDYGLKRK